MDEFFFFFFLSGSFYLLLPGRRRLACRRVRVCGTPLSIARFPENRSVGIARGSADESKEQHAVVQRHSMTATDQLLLDTIKEVVEQMEMKEPEASNRLDRTCTSLAHHLQARLHGLPPRIHVCRGHFWHGSLRIGGKKLLASAGSITLCHRTAESKTNRQ